MTSEICNALFRYFEALYDLNRDLIMLCGADVLDNSGQYDKCVERVVRTIPELIPYGGNRAIDEYVIIEGDGLLEFSNEIPFLRKEYEDILGNNYLALSNIKKVRNKLEHKMHAVKFAGASSGSINLFDITYEINNDKITLEANELIKLVKQINELFTKIQSLVDKYAFDNEKSGYAYYERLLRYSFIFFICSLIVRPLQLMLELVNRILCVILCSARRRWYSACWYCQPWSE